MVIPGMKKTETKLPYTPSKDSQHIYFNRMGFFRHHQFACDLNIHIHYIAVQYPGACQDAAIEDYCRIWRNYALRFPQSSTELKKCAANYPQINIAEARSRDSVVQIQTLKGRSYWCS
ncbi:PREDICTED: uncharacterized protein LOC108354763 [Rhagoletis zephyria]|uniref:uncharacterized protein LOC108354763 n=1 Tax=Rhagoletis zephyria TaxID=28612 RepID=UPI000811205A|nr:PREDICTED: uncharacterized protein LOC108354763 [Rhagoletis zephyria]